MDKPLLYSTYQQCEISVFKGFDSNTQTYAYNSEALFSPSACFI